MYNIHNLEKLLINNNKKLIYIHTPKCSGSYLGSILSYLGIENKGHTQAIQNEGINFTVIRDPIERFESLLNYRLGEAEPRNDWPNELKYVYKEKNISLNEIVAKMSDSQILGFSPYNTLVFWTKNIDIVITLDQFPKLMEYFGYKYDINLFPIKNVSQKIRGKFNIETINRINNLFKDDIILYNKYLN
jgi:hypothetical protein